MSARTPWRRKRLKTLPGENFPAAARALSRMETIKSHIFVKNTKQTIIEVVNYSKNPNCMLKVSSSSSVSTFCNSQFYLQLCEMCPLLVIFLTAICKSGKAAVVGKKHFERAGQL